MQVIKFLSILYLLKIAIGLSTDFCLNKPTFNAHPDDCSKFVICINGSPSVNTCPSPLLFDAELNVCNFQFAVKCMMDTTVSTKTLPEKKETTISIKSTEAPESSTSTSLKITVSAEETVTTTEALRTTDITLSTEETSTPSEDTSTLSEETSTPSEDTSTPSEETSTPSETTSSVEETAKPVSEEFCINKPTFNAHPFDCSKYIVCSNENAIIRSCPGSLLYDATNNICNFPSVIECNVTDTINTTATASTNNKTTLETTTITTKAANFGNITRGTYFNATHCDNNVCKLPNCWCSGTVTPLNIPKQQTPKMILFTMDDNINPDNFNLYKELFDGKTNPNGCKVKTTYFVSGDFNNFELTKDLFDKGHEIAVHTLSHKTPTTFWKTASYEELVEEVVGMKRKLESYGISDVKGYRSPFLQTAGDTTFSVLKDYGFTYDSSLPARLNDVWWPYTLDYDNTPKPCVIEPCPQKSYPGLWEVPLLTQTDGIAECSMFDGCFRYPNTKDGVYKFFKDNFDRHFQASDAPFPMYGHASWMIHSAFSYRKEGLIKFLEELHSRQDVYFVSVSQAIEWMKQPTPLNMLRRNGGPLSCSN